MVHIMIEVSSQQYVDDRLWGQTAMQFYESMANPDYTKKQKWILHFWCFALEVTLYI